MIQVDDIDSYLLAKYSWWLHKGRNTDYARTKIEGKNMYLHRVIMNATDQQIVDHINRDGLDNRRSNLRITTNSINCHNSSKRKYAKGVRLHRGMYRAVFTHPILGFKRILDSFLAEQEAHACYVRYVQCKYPELLTILLPQLSK